MPDDKELDLSKVLEQGTKRTTLEDLQLKGVHNVKVLDERQLHDLVKQAVDSVVTTQTAGERERILAESRKELDRLMSEQTAARSRAKLLEADKNELVEQVESLQRQLDLKGEIEEEELHKKYEEGVASLQDQVEEVRKREQAAQQELQKARAESARLRASGTHELASLQRDVAQLLQERERLAREARAAQERVGDLEKSVAAEQARMRSAEHARTELVGQVLDLQSKAESARQENATSRNDLVKQRAEMTRLASELDAAKAQLARTEEATRQTGRERDDLKTRLSDWEGKAEAGRNETKRIMGQAERMTVENSRLHEEIENAQSTAAENAKQAAEERRRVEEKEREIVSLRAQADLDREKIQELSAKADHAVKEKVRLDEELDRAGAELERARTGLDEERERVRTGEQQARSLEDRLGEEVRQAEGDRKRLEDLTAKADRATIEKVHLEQELARARAELQQVKAGLEQDLARHREEASKTGSEQQARVKELEAGKDRIEAARKALEEELARHREETSRTGSDLQARVKQLEEESARHRDEASKRGSELQARVTELGAGKAQVEAARKQAEEELARHREETSKTGSELQVRVKQLEEELARHGDEASKRGSELQAHVTELEAGKAQVEAARKQAEEELARHREDASKTGSELHARVEDLESEKARVETARKQLEAELARHRDEASKTGSELQARIRELESAERRGESARKQVEDITTVADRATIEKVHLEQELDRALADLRQARAQAGNDAAKIEELDAQLAEEIRRGEADRKRMEELDRARGVLAQAQSGTEQAMARLREEFAKQDAGLQARVNELEAELQGARAEAAFLHGQLGQREKDQETQREKTIYVTAELAQIEERQKAEEREVEALRESTLKLEGDLTRARVDMTAAQDEMRSLQELLAREQDISRGARNETTDHVAKLQELQARSGEIDERARVLGEENARLQERLNSAGTAASVQERLAALENLIGLARKNSEESAGVTAQLRRTLAGQGRPKKKTRVQEPTARSGVALDGKALLQEFFRRIRLKERFTQHVPVQEREGQAHPSDLLVEAVTAIISGDRKPVPRSKDTRLEILGPQKGPELGDLRLFLGRLSPHAVHAISRVHDALRLNLFSLPERPQRITFDVAGLDMGRYRPLLCFDAGAQEFWHGELRAPGDKASQGVVPFLKECVSKVPGGFGWRRIRFRMEPQYFSEDMIRFLNRRGCSYVIQAPDLKVFREAAKQARTRDLSDGWEAGEFTLRIHNIRKTVGRFGVVKRRLSRRKVEGPEPHFRDAKHAYWVFAVDANTSPFRAYQVFAGRDESAARARALLGDFSASRLLGRRRRSHAALFQLSMLASDLVQWFRRKALPMEERGRDLNNLRTDLLMLPSATERPGAARLPVLPKRDRHRRDFDRVTRKIKGLRPVRPFKFRK